MAQYIDKDTVIEKINKLYNSLKEHPGTCGTNYILGFRQACYMIIDFCNSLQGKEVDLDEAARKWEDKVYLEKGWQDEYGTPHAPFSEIGNAFREGAKFMIKAQKGE